MTDATINFNGNQLNYLRESVKWFQKSYLIPFLGILRAVVTPAGIPRSLTDLENNLRALHLSITNGTGQVGSTDSLHRVPVRLLPLAKRILLTYRRHLVAQTESQIAVVTDLDMRATLEKVIVDSNAHNAERWFLDTQAIRKPRLTDYLTLQEVERILASGVSMPGIEKSKLPIKTYDDKFGILSTPSSFAPEFAYWRQQCELRGVGIALAYFDIDNFKAKFNEAYNETIIDRQCLPVILRAVEAHVFGHGTAYHEGGDEFVVLMPNSTKDSAIDFMERLRQTMPILTFPGVNAKANISVGLCHVGPDSILTETEIKQNANAAKMHAKKKAGKNCIVTFRGEKYTEDELEKVRPGNGTK